MKPPNCGAMNEGDVAIVGDAGENPYGVGMKFIDGIEGKEEGGRVGDAPPGEAIGCENCDMAARYACCAAC